jgi:DNA-directed RNA polymerase subunit RPC12/RpoP
MTLLNLTSASLPQYTMTLPVSGTVCKFRPFLVKEEKILLLALQSKDLNQINDSMRNVIMICTNGTIDTKKLCSADAEYAFLQIRSKSIGEEAKPEITCSKCGKQVSVKVKLDEITVKKEKKEKIDPTIKINDNLSIVLRYPSIHDVDHSKNEVEIAFDLAKRCIESVILNDQVHEAKDINQTELSEFVDNMMPDQFAKIMDFISSVPELIYQFKYPCPECKETVNVELKSVSDFFH